MKIVYTHENKIIVENARNVLSVNGIESVLKNEYASGGIGELSAIDTWPEIWVETNDYETASGLIENLIKASSAPTWECESCKEVNGGAFEHCWNCQHESV